MNSTEPFYIDREKLKRLAESPECAIWLSNSDTELRPDIIRLIGNFMDFEKSELTVFAPLERCAGILNNLKHSPKLSYLMASLATLESFQIKGHFISQTPCTDAEVTIQHDYLTRFIDFTNALGFDASPVWNLYFQQPSIKITLSIDEIYEQTPRSGTGKKVEL